MQNCKTKSLYNNHFSKFLGIFHTILLVQEKKKIRYNEASRKRKCKGAKHETTVSRNRTNH